MLFYTNLLDIDGQNYAGWFIVCFFLVNMTINLLLVFINTFRLIRLKCIKQYRIADRKWEKMKEKAQEEKEEEEKIKEEEMKIKEEEMKANMFEVSFNQGDKNQFISSQELKVRKKD